MCRAAAVLPLLLLLSPGLNAQPSIAGDSTWKRGAVCYEIFVRSFYDSDGDGIGDLNGLIQKLDYVNDGNPKTQRDLGARCIWLMPIAESPSYHGYDVADYYTVDREYGTNDDFRRLVAEAHKRGIRVLIDMVLNHASSQHPYFKEALADPTSPYRGWFVFAPRHPGVRNPWGGDNWHKSPVRDEYYYGLFWGGMPDLNYHNPAVREEAKKVARFWLQDMGADGFRLDAIPFLVEENGIVQHAPGTHAVLREYSAYLKRIAPASFTIGEVWDSTGAMLKYYPDQLDAHFAFEASDAIVSSVRAGSAPRLFPAFARLQAALPAHRWAPFLRNHDQTRTMTELKGDVNAAKLAATLLLTMPGLPFVYYGEEIGMTGDKPDERLRTPMHWTRTSAAGFTRGAPWESLQPDSLSANVETQDNEPNSLLNLYRRLIHLRAENAALAGGELVPLVASSDLVAAYLRRDGNRVVMVIANLSGKPITNVRVSSGDRAIPGGRYTPKPLLAHRTAAPLRVKNDGRIDRYVPLRSVGAMASYLFELAPER
jgi:alpha-amylase